MRGRRHEEHFGFAQAAKAEAEVAAWLQGRVPAEWFSSAPEVRVDREEILIVGTLPDVDLGSDAGEDAVEAARNGRVRQFREDTREARMKIAREVEHRVRRQVAWGGKTGDTAALSTNGAEP